MLPYYKLWSLSTASFFCLNWWMNSWPLLKALDVFTLTSSRMFNGVWFHAILILLYIWHPRYSSFPAFPSPLDLTHSSCSKSAEDSEALILIPAALCSLSCRYREGHVSLLGEGSLLLIQGLHCALWYSRYTSLQTDLFNLITLNEVNCSEDVLSLNRTYFW